LTKKSASGTLLRSSSGKDWFYCQMQVSEDGREFCATLSVQSGKIPTSLFLRRNLQEVIDSLERRLF
jgi:hypothetical protein